MGPVSEVVGMLQVFQQCFVSVLFRLFPGSFEDGCHPDGFASQIKGYFFSLLFILRLAVSSYPSGVDEVDVYKRQMLETPWLVMNPS